MIIPVEGLKEIPVIFDGDIDKVVPPVPPDPEILPDTPWIPTVVVIAEEVVATDIAAT